MALKFRKATQGETGRDPIKFIMIRLNPAGWRAMKVLAMDEGTPIQSLMVEAINNLLSKRGRMPVARSPLLRERESDKGHRPQRHLSLTERR
jgi:hypothetical protein